MTHKVQTRRNGHKWVSLCTAQLRTPSRQEPRPKIVHRSQAQGGALRPFRQTVSQLLQAPIARQLRCDAPCRRLVGERGQRRPMHPWWRSTGRAGASSLRSGSDRHQGRLPASRSAAASQQLPSPNSYRPRQLVGRIAAKRNEVRNLPWIDAVGLPDLFGPDAGHFAGPYRVEDLCAVRGKLKNPDRRSRPGRLPPSRSSSATAGQESRPPRSRGLLRLQTRTPPRTRAAPSAARSGRRQTYGRSDRPEIARGVLWALQGVPSDDDRAGSLSIVEPQQKICEADDRARAVAIVTTNRLRQRVVGSVREGVAINHQQWAIRNRPFGGAARARSCGHALSVCGRLDGLSQLSRSLARRTCVGGLPSPSHQFRRRPKLHPYRSVIARVLQSTNSPVNASVFQAQRQRRA